MIPGWRINNSMTEEIDAEARKVILQLEAEPIFAEVGEKVRSMAAELHEKIIMDEMQWILMLTPLKMIKSLKEMCDNEISRREKEMIELSKEDEDGERQSNS